MVIYFYLLQARNSSMQLALLKQAMMVISPLLEARPAICPMNDNIHYS